MDGSRSIKYVDDFDNPLTSAAFKFFCRHLVTLDGLWQPLANNGKPQGVMRPFSYPGVILSVHGTWFLVTAGHTLRKIDEYLKLANGKIIDWCLRDHFGPEPVNKHPVPFNYDDAPAFAVQDELEGLDYGLVALNSNQQALLAANNIVPISKENWASQHEVDFDRHIMLGLPEEFIEHSHVCPTMLRVTQLHDLPDGVSETRYPRFIGKLDARLQIDIKGMSGGPIFGFKKGCDDRYWIVAIQSAWVADRKITFGCPVPVFARIAQDAYEAAFLDFDAEQVSK